MKLKVKIREVAKSQGIENAYQLQKRANLQPSTASRLYRNQVTHITLETLDRLCEGLNCDACDLFVRLKVRSKLKTKGKS